MRYRPEIDGLRTVAVVPVILFHAGFKIFSGGYVGVDVFFVISGYLITTIILSELEEGCFSLSHFYERRARRILPALFTVMACCLPFAYVWMLPDQLEAFSKSLLAVVVFASNILFWSEEGYFASAAELKPLLHTWSLAVEEQYYLLFPLFLMVLWRFGKHTLLFAVVALTLVSLGLSEWGWRNAPSANFFLAPTRAWELFTGSICAFLLLGREPRANNLASMAGLGLIVFAILFFDEHTPFPSVYALAPVAGTALVILFAGGGTLVARLLSTRGFVGVGLISYSAYLWHQPLFAFARLRDVHEPSAIVMGSLAILAILLAWITWWFVEQPFRKRAPVFPRTRRTVFVASGAVGLVFMSIGLAGYLGDGFKWRLTPEQLEIEKFAQYPTQEIYEEGRCFLRPEQDYLAYSETCTAKGTGAMLIGDSHAAALASYLGGRKGFARLTASACPPALNFDFAKRRHCRAINDFWVGKIRENSPKYLYLHANWAAYWDFSGFKDALRVTIETLSEMGPQIILVGAVPRFQPNLPKILLNRRVQPVAGTKAGAQNVVIRQVNSDLGALALATGVLFWDPVQELCDAEDSCLAVTEAVDGDMSIGQVSLLVWDYGHLTLTGASELGNRLMYFARHR